MAKSAVQNSAVPPLLSTDLMVGVSAPMQRLRDQIARIARTEASVLILGESGSGKEMVARAIHEQSLRSQRPFLAINCAAIPETLIESELFGHAKGAFSGAVTYQKGMFTAADGGTLLLDEIGDLPLSVQAKFLRVLQEGEVRAVGSTESKKVDVRVIAATHQKLKQKVHEGQFREDLFFRLDVVELMVPPLRERKEDLVELSYYFLREMSERHQKSVTSISDGFLSALYTHTWPGNVRELGNVIERAVVFSQGPELLLENLPAHLIALCDPAFVPASGAQSVTFKIGTPLKDVEDLMIKKTLEATAGDKNMTAKILGINSRTIYRKLEKQSAGETEEV